MKLFDVFSSETQRQTKICLLQSLEKFHPSNISRRTFTSFPCDLSETYLEKALAGGGTLRGRCPICEQKAYFTYPADYGEKLQAHFIRSGFDTSILLGDAHYLRESLNCSVCNSANRERQVAYVLKNVLQRTSWRQYHDLAVLNAESQGALHDCLAKNSRYFCSEFFGAQYESGEFVHGVRHEDFQALSFPDESLDIVITRDVFEHIPDPYKAHAEVFRVLKKGGRHIFTVPFDAQAFTDVIRAEAIGDADVVHHLPPIYHLNPVDPASGALVYRIFSYEMLMRLRETGFQPKIWNIYAPECGIVGFNAMVFEACKEE